MTTTTSLESLRAQVSQRIRVPCPDHRLIVPRVPPNRCALCNGTEVGHGYTTPLMGPCRRRIRADFGAGDPNFSDAKGERHPELCDTCQNTGLVPRAFTFYELAALMAQMRHRISVGLTHLNYDIRVTPFGGAVTEVVSGRAYGSSLAPADFERAVLEAVLEAYRKMENVQAVPDATQEGERDD